MWPSGVRLYWLDVLRSSHLTCRCGSIGGYAVECDLAYRRAHWNPDVHLPSEAICFSLKVINRSRVSTSGKIYKLNGWRCACRLVLHKAELSALIRKRWSTALSSQSDDESAISWVGGYIPDSLGEIQYAITLNKHTEVLPPEAMPFTLAHK